MQLKEIELWLDMQLSPKLASWIESYFSVKTISSYDLFINEEKDEVIFAKTKKQGNVIILSKDTDFLLLIERLKSPPKLIWLTMSNCPNKQMKDILSKTLLPALQELIKTPTSIVEVS